MNDKMQHRLFAGFSFLLSLAIYLKTMAPTVAFWDCGEFIACAYRLAIPHPPGAPLYLLVGRVFTLIPAFIIEDIAKRVNLISALSSAVTILFLHMTIVHLIKEYMREELADPFLKYVPHIGAVIGSLAFAFSHSFWFNAVEAEVYAPSMLFTGICVWLVFRWSEKSDEIGNEKYLLLIAYMMGLAIGVHLLNVLTLPMIFLVIYYKRFEINMTTFFTMVAIGLGLTLLVYPGMVKGIPVLVHQIGFEGMIFLVVAAGGILGYAVNNGQKALALVITCLLLITIGYSSYLMIYIRSGLDPNIDENNPETVEKFISYMNREQYGEHHFDRARRWKESPNGNQYSSGMDFFWRYQINEMYVRYFLWNFGGIEENTNFSRERKRADVMRFWALPLLLGLIGGYYHFMKDRRHGLAIFVLFFMTGLAIVLYLNQPDPQPRERDYSYVGSFFAFSIWIGIGAAAILENIYKAVAKKEGAGGAIGWIVAVLLFALVPMRMMAVNYNVHDRTGNFVAHDYSRNMLASAGPNGIMFTNGDNDTFPLWYLQEVEKYRTDVRVANLSLLNTSWYIEQLKNKEPKVPISFSDTEIEAMKYPVPWKERKVEVSTISETARRAEAERYRLSLGIDDSLTIPDKVTFNVKPKMQIPGRGGALRIQDWMILNILITNQFENPIYFAVTTSDQNRLDELKRYQKMDGLLFQVTSIRDWTIEPEKLYDNLMNKFVYRNLNNPDVYYNENIIGLLQNYRSAFFRLGTHYLDSGNEARFEEVMQRLYEIMPPEVIPFTHNQFEEVLTAFATMANVYSKDQLTVDSMGMRQLQAVGEISLNYKKYDLAEVAYQQVLAPLLDNPQGELVQSYMRGITRNPALYDQATEDQRNQILQSAISQIKRQIVTVYKDSKNYDTAIEVLNGWLSKDANDQYAKQQLDAFKNLKATAEAPEGT